MRYCWKTYSTAKPDSLIILAVPPEAKRRTLCLIKPFAKSSKPVLSYTEMIAIIKLEGDFTAYFCPKLRTGFLNGRHLCARSSVSLSLISGTQGRSWKYLHFIHELPIQGRYEVVQKLWRGNTCENRISVVGYQPGLRHLWGLGQMQLADREANSDFKNSFAAQQLLSLQIFLRKYQR